MALYYLPYLAWEVWWQGTFLISILACGLGVGLGYWVLPRVLRKCGG